MLLGLMLLLEVAFPLLLHSAHELVMRREGRLRRGLERDHRCLRRGLPCAVDVAERAGVGCHGREYQNETERPDETHHEKHIRRVKAAARRGCRAVATVTRRYGESPAYSLGLRELPFAGYELLYSAGNPTHGHLR